jgi:glycopeptide antibiotics resistance protein
MADSMAGAVYPESTDINSWTMMNMDEAAEMMVQNCWPYIEMTNESNYLRTGWKFQTWNNQATFIIQHGQL